MSKEWYLENTNIVGSLENNKLEEQKSQFDQYLNISPEVKDVLVNDENHRMVIHSTTNDNERRVLFKDHLIDRGDIVDFDSRKWLAVEMAHDDYFYWSTLVKMCNLTIPIVIQEGSREIVGYDDLNRPIYEETDPIIEDVPCIIENRIDSVYDLSNPINLPEGRLKLTLPLSHGNKLNEGDTVRIEDSNYRVYTKDISLVLDGEGVLILYVRHVVED